MPKKTAKNNSRKITEGLPKESPKSVIDTLNKPSKISVLGHEITIYFTVVLAMCAAFFLVVLAFLFFRYGEEQNKWLAARDNYAYWEQVAKITKNSPDAYYQAGVFAIEVGEINKGVGYLKKSLELDPDFENARSLIDAIER